MNQSKSLIVPWDVLAEQLECLEYETLSKLAKIDLTYDVLNEFIGIYESEQGVQLNELPENVLDELYHIIQEEIEKHWSSAKILEKLVPLETYSSLVSPDYLSIVKKSKKGLHITVHEEFIPVFNQEIDNSESIIISSQDVQPFDVAMFINALCTDAWYIDTSDWDTAFEGVDYKALATVLEREWADDGEVYYTETAQRYTPKPAWALEIAQIQKVLLSEDARARRPLLLALWPEYVLRVPYDESDTVHTAIYREYHLGDLAELTNIDDLESRHEAAIQSAVRRGVDVPKKLLHEYGIQPTANARYARSRNPIPRVRRSLQDRDQVTLLAEAAAARVIRQNRQLSKNRLELVEKAKPLIRKLLNSRTNLLDVPDKAAALLSKRA